MGRDSETNTKRWIGPQLDYLLTQSLPVPRAILNSFLVEAIASTRGGMVMLREDGGGIDALASILDDAFDVVVSRSPDAVLLSPFLWDQPRASRHADGTPRDSWQLVCDAIIRYRLVSRWNLHFLRGNAFVQLLSERANRKVKPEERLWVLPVLLSEIRAGRLKLCLLPDRGSLDLLRGTTFSGNWVVEQHFNGLESRPVRTTIEIGEIRGVANRAICDQISREVFGIPNSGIDEILGTLGHQECYLISRRTLLAALRLLARAWKTDHARAFNATARQVLPKVIQAIVDGEEMSPDHDVIIPDLVDADGIDVGIVRLKMAHVFNQLGVAVASYDQVSAAHQRTSPKREDEVLDWLAPPAELDDTRLLVDERTGEATWDRQALAISSREGRLLFALRARRSAAVSYFHLNRIYTSDGPITEILSDTSIPNGTMCKNKKSLVDAIVRLNAALMNVNATFEVGNVTNVGYRLVKASNRHRIS